VYFLQIVIFERQQRTLYGVGFSDDLVREIEKQFSFFGESKLSLRSIDELRSGLFLKLGDLGADRRLRLVHARGCEAEAPAFADRYQRPKIVSRQVHNGNES
jgi:hypothetical protein